MKKIFSLILILTLSTMALGASFADVKLVNDPVINEMSGDVVIQVEPGVERYTVVYEYATTGHYVTKTEAGYYMFTNTSFWTILGWALKPVQGFLFNFAQGIYYVPQVNDFIRPYTAVTYDALANKFDWTMHTTAIRNGMVISETFDHTYFYAGSSGYAGLMQKYGHLISTTH